MASRRRGWLLVGVAAAVAGASGAWVGLRGDAGSKGAVSSEAEDGPEGEGEGRPAPPPAPTRAVLKGRVGPGGPVLSMADPGPLAAAVAFLLRCQGADGLFHA